MFGLNRLSLGLLLAAATSPALAAIAPPFTEEFATDANWRDALSASPTFNASGGAPGSTGGFITVNKAYAATPSGPESTFRGQGNLNSSNLAFTGNWITAQVGTLSFWLRQHSTTNMDIGVRFASPSNAQGVTYISPNQLVPEVWTKFTIQIDPGNPLITPESSNFATVFGNLGNLQLLTGGDASHAGQSFTVDLDAVGVATPEPAGMLLAGAGMFFAARRTRRAKLTTERVA